MNGWEYILHRKAWSLTDASARASLRRFFIDRTGKEPKELTIDEAMKFYLMWTYEREAGMI